MAKFAFTLLVCLTFAFTAFANGPVQERWEDVSVGTCDPILSNWGLDVVTWNTMTPVPAGTYRSANGVIGDWFYIFGSQTTFESWGYDHTADSWAASTDPLMGYCNWAGAVADGQLYVGPRYASGYYTDCQVFTPTAGSEPAGTWAMIAPYPMAICGVGMAWDGNDTIYGTGGGGGSGTVANCYAYSISADTWTAIPSLPAATMKYHGSAFCGGELHVVGGITSPFTSHYSWTPGATSWVTEPAPPTGISFALFNTGGDPSFSKMYVIGGGGGYGSWPAIDDVQIYDPATDTWTQETPLPTAKALTAAKMVDMDMGICAGGYPATSTQTYVGTGFAAGPPSFTVTLTYLSGSPVPPGGGGILFDVTLQNNETSPQNFDLWIEIPPQITPPGVPNRNLTFPGGFSLTRPGMNWPIPGSWPAGNYSMEWYIGNLASLTVWASDSFPFTKSADDGGSYALWEVDSDPLDQLFEGTEFGNGMVSDFALLGNYPNPFNPTTTISYTLENAGKVELAVYDLTGSLVTTLVDGYRSVGTHEVTFDATGLASGVYVYNLTSGSSVATGKMILMK